MTRTKLLIVDDEQRIIDKFAGFAEDYEVRAAKSKLEAIAIAREFMPEIATVDFGIYLDNGNEVGAALMEICPRIRMAGITGGYPEDFDRALFDIRESKYDMNRSTYRSILEDLWLRSKHVVNT